MNIANALGKAQIKYNLYAPRQLSSDPFCPFDGGPRDLFAKLFDHVDGIIAVMAVGIVVRGIASLIVNKKTDPAVVVVDDLGKYAISLLSGHIGGANRLAKIIAQEIGAIPIITTATELLGRRSVEEIAEEHDLAIVNFESLTPVNSAIVNDLKILVAALRGVAYPTIEDVDPKFVSDIDQLKQMIKDYDAGIVIAPTVLSLQGLTKPVVILTPKSPPRLSEENSE
jgi:cobalt-precorrin 5A hydrolase